MPLSLVVSHLVHVGHLDRARGTPPYCMHHLLVVYLSLALKLMEWLGWSQRLMQESMQL